MRPVEKKKRVIKIIKNKLKSIIYLNCFNSFSIDSLSRRGKPPMAVTVGSLGTIFLSQSLPSMPILVSFNCDTADVCISRLSAVKTKEVKLVFQ